MTRTYLIRRTLKAELAARLTAYLTHRGFWFDTVSNGGTTTVAFVLTVRS